MSRTACLGNDAFALIEQDSLLFRVNLQKGRADLLLGNPKFNARRNQFAILKFIQRDDVIWHILGQSDRRYRKMPKPRYILFDSYSDLTDVEFLDKSSGTRFFCHKSDLVPLDESGNEISIIGHLNLENIESMYKRLFDSFHYLWGVDIKIFFIHFPKKLETRDLYIRRAKLIERAIDKLANLDKTIVPIKIPEYIVQPEILPNGKVSTFPYHFSEDSKRYIAHELGRLINRPY